MHLRDVLFQAYHLAGKAMKAQGEVVFAAGQFSSALGPWRRCATG